MNKYKSMKKAAKLAVKCMKYISNFLEIGVSEKTISKIIKEWFLSHGASGLSFDSIVAFGSNAANPHHKPTTRKLTAADVVVIDIGCIYNGYCSDITRTFLPDLPSQEQQTVYDLVLKANIEGIKQTKIGMKAEKLDSICRKIIKSERYDKYFIHTTGHGIGKVVHEGYRIGPKDKTIIDNDMYFTIEPGIYLKNKFGIRIEDTVCFHKNKLVVLTKKAKK